MSGTWDDYVAARSDVDPLWTPPAYSAYDIGWMIALLFVLFVISRGLLWLTREWRGGDVRLWLVHGISFMVGAIAFALDVHDWYGNHLLQGTLEVVVPVQLLWLVVDLVRKPAPTWSSKECRREAS
jgi:hypothetical protein